MKPAGDVPDCYLRKETMISDSAHSYQLGYAKGKQEERKKVLSEVEGCISVAHTDQYGNATYIVDWVKLDQMKARE